jgi:succinate-acetate transporter protein
VSQDDRAGPGSSRRALLWLALLGLGSVLGPILGARHAPSALVDLGPNDTAHVRGFREDWERDGSTRFRWTTYFSTLDFPLRASGEGFRLRLRLRRHFIEPAHVRLIVEGRAVHAFDVAADLHVPYRTLEIALPRLEGVHPFVLGIEAPSDNPRALGIALDWVELERGGPGGFGLLLPAILCCVLASMASCLGVRLAGGSSRVALCLGAAIVVAASLGAYRDPVALDRIVREGAPALVAFAVIGALALRASRVREALSIPGQRVAGALLALGIAALALRLVILLHPLFYYPDVKVHALFAWQLARRGLAAFLQDFLANQYRFSLGLQLEKGHWYAFPYPPGFYLLTWPLVRLLGYRPEIAVGLTAAFVNSVELFLVFAIARRLGASDRVSLAAAGVAGILPLFTARLGLAYFPAITGHAFDAALILYLLAKLGELDRPRVIATAALLLALCLLVYTQALVNFGILLPLFFVLQAIRDRTPGRARRLLGLAAAGALGVILALGTFYARYVPVVRDMAGGVPLPEERILLEKLERARPDEDAAPEEPDPYTGSSLDPWRGMRKAAWRLYVFYGPLAPAVLAGLLIALPLADPSRQRFTLAWASTYLILNLASGGLPGPNWLRYNKDLEIVAPLCCLALAAVGGWLWRRSRPLACAYAAGVLTFGLWRAARSLTDRIILEP